MAARAMTPEVRELARKVAEAGDEQVIGIVQLVDAIAERGPADDLVAPLRPRLAQLRPPRLINFTRLLFTPLDGVIVPGQRWKPGALAVPRPALAPLAGVVQGQSGGAWTALRQLDSTPSRLGDAQLAEAGSVLWPRAADILACATMPARWCDEAGLPEAVFAPIARGVAATLRHGVMLLRLPTLDPPAQEEAIAKMVADTGKFGPEALGLLAAVLLARLPGSARVLTALPRQAAEGVVGRMLDGLGDGMAQPPSRQGLSLGQEAADTARLAATLDALEDRANRPDLRRRAQQIRRDAEAACRERFSHAVESELPRRLAEMSPGAGDVEVAALETMARDVRRLEQAGRRLGGGSAYEAVLNGTSALLAGPTGEALTLADRVRLAEILLGPEAALELLRS